MLIFIALRIMKLGKYRESCTVENSNIEQINHACEEYVYSNSVCDKCNLTYESDSSVVFRLCTIISSATNTIIKLANVKLKIIDSNFTISSESGTLDIPVLISMENTSINMFQAVINGEDSSLVLKSPTIESIDPVWPTEFNNCIFEDIHCDNISGGGIFLDSMSEYEVKFTSCVFENTGTTMTQGNCGGFYYQNIKENISYFINCSFSRCNAYQGGALYFTSRFYIADCNFDNCSSFCNGQIIYFQINNKRNEYVFTRCTVKNCKGDKPYVTIQISKSPHNLLEFDNICFQDNDISLTYLVGYEIIGDLTNLNLNDCKYIRNECVSPNPEEITNYVILNVTRCEFIDNHGDMGHIISQAGGLNIMDCLFDQVFCVAFLAGPNYSNSYNTTFRRLRSAVVFSFKFQNNYDSVIFKNCTFDSIEGDYFGKLGIFLSENIYNFCFNECKFLDTGSYDSDPGLMEIPQGVGNFRVIKCTIISGKSFSKGVFSNRQESFDKVSISFIDTSFIGCSSNENNISAFSIIRNTNPINLTVIGCNFKDAPPRNLQISAAVSSVTLRDCIFTNIGRTFEISMQTNNPLQIYNFTFSNCSSNQQIFTLNIISELSFHGCIFKNITSKNDNVFGIGSMQPSVLIEVISITDCIFERIRSKNQGFVFQTASAVIRNTTFVMCEADYGTCLYIKEKTILVVSNSTFLSNHAFKSGGCIYVEPKVIILTSDIWAVDNTADISGGFICIDEIKVESNITGIDGYGNSSPFGVTMINGVEKGYEIIMKNFYVYDVAFSNITKLTLRNSMKNPMTIKAADIGELIIENIQLQCLNVSCQDLKLDSISFVESTTIQLDSPDISIKNSNFINSSNVMINSSAVRIDSCKFNYYRDSSSQTQLMIKSISKISIQNSCFITNMNEFSAGDHIISDYPVELTIDDNSCFNQDISKSLSLQDGSKVNHGNVFNCQRECFNEGQEVVNPKPSKKTEIIIISVVCAVVIVITIIIIIVVVAKKSKNKELKELSILSNSREASQDGEMQMTDLQIQIDASTLKRSSSHREESSDEYVHDFE